MNRLKYFEEKAGNIDSQIEEINYKMNLIGDMISKNSSTYANLEKTAIEIRNSLAVLAWIAKAGTTCFVLYIFYNFFRV